MPSSSSGRWVTSQLCRAVAVLAVVGACSAPPFGAPDVLDDGTLVLVNRTAEGEIVDEIEAMWEEIGADEHFGAVYEFEMIPYKPIFFSGVARGVSTPPGELLQTAIVMFGGVDGPSSEPRERTVEGLGFVCAPFNTHGVLGTQPMAPGQGLAALSAACAWSADGEGGFGVSVAGADVEQTLDRAHELRTGVAR